MDSDDVNHLLAKRKNIKASLMRFKQYIEEAYKNSPDKEQLIQRTEVAKELLPDFKLVQDEIEFRFPDNPNHESKREDFENQYFSIIANAQRLINSETQSIPSTSISSHGSKNQNSDQINVQLPKIDLPTFSGNYEEWICFRDSFKASVHINNTIKAIDKLQYLRASLKSEAAEIIESIKNYEKAWHSLKEKYENRRILVQTHIRALFNLPAMTKESHLQLPQLIDNVLKHTRVLKTLGEPTDSWGAILIHLVTSKLDRESRRQWESSVNDTEMPKFNELVQFLRNRCQALKNMRQEDSSSATIHKRPRVTSGTVPSDDKPQYSYVNTSPCCYFCKGDHYVAKCRELQALDYNDKRAKVSELRLCFNCLNPNHSSRGCHAGNCRKCNLRHHTLLHPPDDEVTKSGSS